MLTDPFVLFGDLFARAASRAPASPVDHTAAALATATREGRPSVRMVLVRRFDPHGFLFFTNYGSRKADELLSNPAAALCFYWFWLEEQVRIEGRVERATATESDEYFATRPRGSQIGAWASVQSHQLGARSELEDRYRTIEQQYAGEEIPRPPFWGGYRLRPQRIEFWKAGTYRLHERLVFTRTDTGSWDSEFLYP